MSRFLEVEGTNFEMSEEKAQSLCAHGVIVPIEEEGTYRLCTPEELERDPGSPWNNPSALVHIFKMLLDPQ